MSEENVEVIKEAFPAWNRGDMDAVTSAVSEDVIFDPLAGWPEGDEIAGAEAVRERYRDMRDGFERDWMEIREIRDLGEAQVLADFEWCGIPLGGHGEALRLHVFGLFEFRDGWVTHIAYYPGHDEALEAAGLSE